MRFLRTRREGTKPPPLSFDVVLAAVVHHPNAHFFRRHSVEIDAGAVDRRAEPLLRVNPQLQQVLRIRVGFPAFLRFFHGLIPSEMQYAQHASVYAGRFRRGPWKFSDFFVK